MRECVHEKVAGWAAQKPGHLAVTCVSSTGEKTRITYGQLHDASTSLAKLLRTAG
jgi:acyl-coenzyme A synthetase/AMP-(fatty) acid ligase